MFARVTVIQASPDLVDEGIRQVREEILPGFQELPGFKAGYFLVNRRRGKVNGLSAKFLYIARSQDERGCSAC